MNKIPATAALLVTSLLSLTGCYSLKGKEPQQISVSDVVGEINKALDEVSRKAPPTVASLD